MELETYNKIFEKLVEGIEKVPYPCLISERVHPNVKQDIGHPGAVRWLQKILRYNVLRYSQFRGLCVPVIYKATIENPTTEDVELANILGMVYQIHQVYVLMVDDIGDQSVQRLGQQTWHTFEEVKPHAINDLALTEHIAYKILRYYFGHLGQTYHKMLDLLLNASYVTWIGQHVEISHTWEKCPDKFCYELYFQKLILKTCYCMYNLPFKLAILFAGITEEENKEVWELVDEITLDLGYLIQIQDDYIDNFHETNEDDILTGTCNWIFLKAKELCNAEQWEILKKNYGCDDKEKIAVVRKMYETLDVKKAFLEEQKKWSDKLKDKVGKLPPMAKGVGVGAMHILNALCTCTDSDFWH